jgi:hypothetical protein
MDDRREGEGLYGKGRVKGDSPIELVFARASDRLRGIEGQLQRKGSLGQMTEETVKYGVTGII